MPNRKDFTALEYLKIDIPNVNDFVLSIIKKQYNKALPYHLNTYFVLDRIHNRKIRKQVIKHLIELNFDFLAPFPEDDFKEIIQVTKTIENLKKEYDYFIYYINKGNEFLTTDDLRCISLYCNPKITEFAFRIGYDMVLQITKEKQVIISLNPYLKKQGLSLYNVYNKLNKMEKDTWILWENNLVLKTLKDKATSLSSEELNGYVKNFTLK